MNGLPVLLPKTLMCLAATNANNDQSEAEYDVTEICGRVESLIPQTLSTQKPGRADKLKRSLALSTGADS